MSEQTIDRINEGVALVLFIAPLARWCCYSKDASTIMVLALIWSFLLLLYCFDWMMMCFARRDKYLWLVKRVNGGKYEISRLSLYLFMFILSLIVILMMDKGFCHLNAEKVKEIISGSTTLFNMFHWTVRLLLLVGIGLLGYLVVYALRGVFVGFIFVEKIPKDEMPTEPKHESLSDESQQLIAILQECSELSNDGNINKSSMLKAVAIIFRDFLDDFKKMQGRQATGDEIISLDYLRNYIPSMNQIRMYPKESLELMLSSSEFIDSNFIENPYFNFRMINEICLTVVEKKIGMLKTMKTE